MKLPALKETEIQKAVVDHWKVFALPFTLVAAIPNAKAHGQAGLTPGIYDLLVMGPNLPGGFPVGFLELKRERGTKGAKVSTAQETFGSLCESLGILHAVAWGREEPIAVLEEWNVVKRARR